MSHELSNHAEDTGNSGSTELRGLTAVVTGSSSGIGRSVALELARGGARVVVHARRNRAAAEAVATDIQRFGGTVTVLLYDLGEPAQQDALADAAWRWQNGVDIWINNAGADVLTGEAARWTFEEKLEQLWRVDGMATIRLSRAIGRRMMDRGGSVVNVGWDQAEHGMAGESAEMFTAVKGAVMAFSKSLAQSLAPRVRVNCIAPGWIKTAWGERAPSYWQDRACGESLLRRWGTAEDVARTVRFLVSPAAAFVNGQVIAVNGGWRRSPVTDP